MLCDKWPSHAVRQVTTPTTRGHCTKQCVPKVCVYVTSHNVLGRQLSSRAHCRTIHLSYAKRVQVTACRLHATGDAHSTQQQTESDWANKCCSMEESGKALHSKAGLWAMRTRVHVSSIMTQMVILHPIGRLSPALESRLMTRPGGTR